MIIDLNLLPQNIQNKIPLSIRSAGNLYELSSLPPLIQELIREYTQKDVKITYKTIFDLKPAISKYSDIYGMSTIKETIAEYLKNYFYTLPGSYPFDPSFGCRLKYHLQTRDTQLRRLLITDEINNIVNIVSSDLGLPIIVNNIDISSTSAALNTTLTCSISLTIPGEENIKIDLSLK